MPGRGAKGTRQTAARAAKTAITPISFEDTLFLSKLTKKAAKDASRRTAAKTSQF